MEAVKAAPLPAIWEGLVTVVPSGEGRKEGEEKEREKEWPRRAFTRLADGEDWADALVGST